MNPADLAFVEEVEATIGVVEPLGMFLHEKRQKRLCAIAREQNASIVSLQGKLADETAQCELVTSQLEDAMGANRELDKANTALFLERDALRERLAKLEAAARVMAAAFVAWSDGGSTPRLCDAGEALLETLDVLGLQE